jgi:hypothetical protein
MRYIRKGSHAPSLMIWTIINKSSENKSIYNEFHHKDVKPTVLDAVKVIAVALIG